MIASAKSEFLITKREPCMPESNVISFGEDTRTMTYAEGFAFIERTRRQLDRFDVALARGEGQTFPPEGAAKIRRQLDELEADLRKSVGID
jgi:hypothetical protein